MDQYKKETIELKNHPRIKNVTYTYRGTSTWEEILKQIIINYLESQNLTK